MVQIGRKITKPVAYRDDGSPKPLYKQFHRNTIQRDLIDLGYYVDVDSRETVYEGYHVTKDNYPEGELPNPSGDLDQLRNDLMEFGYCLVENALSYDQLSTLRTRLDDQSAGERAANVARYTAQDKYGVFSSQSLLTLINKGECFRELVELAERTVAKGPLLEQLIEEMLGREFLINSIAAAIAGPGGTPQMLHCGQSMIPKPWPPWPYECFAGFLLDDFSNENGGTLGIPRSHKIFTDAGTNPILSLPPTVNITAPAGTALIMDGRVAHGTGTNFSDQLRRLIITTWHKPFIRQQEQYHLTVRREVFETASDKLKLRLGFKAWSGGLGGYEGHGEGSYAPIRDGYLSVGELNSKGEGIDSPEQYTIHQEQAEGSREEQIRMRQKNKLITRN